MFFYFFLNILFIFNAKNLESYFMFCSNSVLKTREVGKLLLLRHKLSKIDKLVGNIKT